MKGLLSGKVAVITGSTQGLGAAIATRFSEEGARIALTGLSVERGEAFSASLRNGAIFVPADLSKAEDCRRLMEAALQSFGHVDILINSAANTKRSTIEDFTVELFDEQFHTNLRAPLLLAQCALPSLKERNGTIINIGSVNAYMGWPNLLLYAATKSALMTVSRNMANALKYARVRVHCLNVGWMDTEGEREVMKELGHPENFLDEQGKRFPCGRLIHPKEVAELCLLLASEKGVAFSGAVIDLEQFPIGAPHDPASERNPTL